MEKRLTRKVNSITKTILVSTLIILSIIFIYPLGSIILVSGLDLFLNSSDSDLIKGFGKVKIENYERYEDLGKEKYESNYKAIYFNDEQASKIKEQIISDVNWSTIPFEENILDKYYKTNIKSINNAYYYIIELDKDFHTIETNRDVIDKNGANWYNSAIFDTENNVLYYYCKQYEK